MHDVMSHLYNYPLTRNHIRQVVLLKGLQFGDKRIRAVPGAYLTGFCREYVLPIKSSTLRL